MPSLEVIPCECIDEPKLELRVLPEVKTGSSIRRLKSCLVNFENFVKISL